jgi:hypothetical protein
MTCQTSVWDQEQIQELQGVGGVVRQGVDMEVSWGMTMMMMAMRLGLMVYAVI